eukprot:scaffold3769_cov54-Phaeocystis_antarctica.AAC.2
MLMKNECRRAQPLTVPTTPTRRTTASAAASTQQYRPRRAVLLPPNTLCLRTGPAGPGPCVLKRVASCRARPRHAERDRHLDRLLPRHLLVHHLRQLLLVPQTVLDEGAVSCSCFEKRRRAVGEASADRRYIDVSICAAAGSGSLRRPRRYVSGRGRCSGPGLLIGTPMHGAAALAATATRCIPTAETRLAQSMVAAALGEVSPSSSLAACRMNLLAACGAAAAALAASDSACRAISASQTAPAPAPVSGWYSRCLVRNGWKPSSGAAAAGGRCWGVEQSMRTRELQSPRCSRHRRANLSCCNLGCCCSHYTPGSPVDEALVKLAGLFGRALALSGARRAPFSLFPLLTKSAAHTPTQKHESTSRTHGHATCCPTRYTSVQTPQVVPAAPQGRACT